MYERKEQIEEENLDWGVDLEKLDDEIAETRHIPHSDSTENKIAFKNRVNIRSKLNIKKRTTTLLHDYSELSLLLSLLIFPYIIGFFVIAFILLSGGVPIDSFFSLKEQIFHFELWSIGSYIFITVGVIWLVITLLLQRR